MVHQPDLGRPAGGDALAGKSVFLGQLQAGEQRPGDRPSVGGHEPDHDVGVGEMGALGHVDDVRQRHQTAAEPDGGPVHGGDHGHSAGDHPGHDLPTVGQGLAPQHRITGQFIQIGEVPAGRERPAVAREHHGAHLVVGIDLREQTRQPGVQLVIGGVQLLGAVQPHDAHGPLCVHLDMRPDLVGAHATGSPRMRRATRLRWIWEVPPMTLCARL